MKLLPEIYNFYQIQENLLYRLLGSLYSLKKFEKLWNQNIIAFYKLISFKQLNGDLGILIYCLRDEINIGSVFIADFFLTSNKINIFNILK